MAVECSSMHIPTENMQILRLEQISFAANVMDSHLLKFVCSRTWTYFDATRKMVMKLTSSTACDTFSSDTNDNDNTTGGT